MGQRHAHAPASLEGWGSSRRCSTNVAARAGLGRLLPVSFLLPGKKSGLKCFSSDFHSPDLPACVSSGALQPPVPVMGGTEGDRAFLLQPGMTPPALCQGAAGSSPAVHSGFLPVRPAPHHWGEVRRGFLTVSSGILAPTQMFSCRTLPMVEYSCGNFQVEIC